MKVSELRDLLEDYDPDLDIVLEPDLELLTCLTIDKIIGLAPADPQTGKGVLTTCLCLGSYVAEDEYM